MSDERLYRITPLEKKSVEYFVDVFERQSDGTIRGFDVTEIYRWGQGFREEDDIPWRFETETNNGVHCRPEVGWGCELDDLCSMHVNFSDGFTDAEKAEIEALCRGEKEDEDGRWGTAWIYDGDHNWEIEDDHVRIIGPVKIDLVDANGYGDSAIIEANVQPYDNNEKQGSTDWPFPNEN
jgi:hypothetical protein